MHDKLIEFKNGNNICKNSPINLILDIHTANTLKLALESFLKEPTKDQVFTTVCSDCEKKTVVQICPHPTQPIVGFSTGSILPTGRDSE